jgi:hypothetical protein
MGNEYMWDELRYALQEYIEDGGEHRRLAEPLLDALENENKAHIEKQRAAAQRWLVSTLALAEEVDMDWFCEEMQAAGYKIKPKIKPQPVAPWWRFW